MPIELPLDSMSVAEKLQLMETIWANLCQNPATIETPDWHQHVLAERAQRLADGEATVASWQAAKTRLLKLGQ